MDGSQPITAQTGHASGLALRKALPWITACIERWNTIPVLGMLRLDFAPGQITLMATDLDNHASLTLTEGGSHGAAFTVLMTPATLITMVRYHDGDVQFSFNPAQKLLTMTAGELRATIRTFCGVEDWPLPVQTVPTGGRCADAIIGAAQFVKALRAVEHCISTEETRYYLNGAYLHAEDNHLRAVATDGHRLARYDMPDAAWALPPMIFPTRALRLVASRIETSSNETLHIRAFLDAPDKEGKQHVRSLLIDADGWKLQSKTIDGTYPDYTRVCPPMSDALTATISYAALRSLPTHGDLRGIKIDPEAKRMRVRSSEGDEYSLPVTAKGDQPFGFNLNYLRQFAQRGGMIRIHGAGAGGPFNVLTEDPNLLQILMPMRV